MAIDTRQKRASAVTINVPSLVPNIVPTGTIDQNERQASIWSYSGISAAVLSLIVARPKSYDNRQVSTSTLSVSTTTSTLTSSKDSNS